MRRFLVALLLALLLAPSTSFAAKPAPWHTYTNSKLAFGLSYPPGWKVSPTYAGRFGQVVFGFSGKSSYGLTVSSLPISPGKTVRATLANFIAYERKLHDTSYAKMRWSAVSLAGHPAMGAVASPPTEGGVIVSDAIYITQGRRRVYEISMIAYHRPPLTKLSQFPAVYQQMLRTWKVM